MTDGGQCCARKRPTMLDLSMANSNDRSWPIGASRPEAVKRITYLLLELSCGSPLKLKDIPSFKTWAESTLSGAVK